MKRVKRALREALQSLKTATNNSGQATLLIGLRNPGAGYAGTRHNIGADAVSAVAERLGSSFRSAPRSIPAEVADGKLGERRARLALPTTFMNESSQAVGPLLRYFQPDSFIVAHDDIDLAFGTMRIHHGRGAGGHNGMADVIASLESRAVPRLRFGVGRPPESQNPIEYVLSPFSAREEEGLVAPVEHAARAVATFAALDIEAAMNRFNPGPERQGEEEAR